MVESWNRWSTAAMGESRRDPRSDDRGYEGQRNSEQQTSNGDWIGSRSCERGDAGTEKGERTTDCTDEHGCSKRGKRDGERTTNGHSAAIGRNPRRWRIEDGRWSSLQALLRPCVAESFAKNLRKLTKLPQIITRIHTNAAMAPARCWIAIPRKQLTWGWGYFFNSLRIA